jgi:DNA-binding Xre family transcriptional regulator
MKHVRFNLALMRAMRGKLTQRDVSLATGLSQKTLSALETGASKGVEFSTLARLCQFLKCTPDDLLLLEDEIEDIVPSKESIAKAKDIVSKGLLRSMNAPAQSPEEIWAEFDALRNKIAVSQQEERAKERA